MLREISAAMTADTEAEAVVVRGVLSSFGIRYKEQTLFSFDHDMPVHVLRKALEEKGMVVTIK